MRYNKTKKNIKAKGGGWPWSKKVTPEVKITSKPTPVNIITSNNDLAAKSILQNDPSSFQKNIKDSEQVLAITAAMSSITAAAAITGIGLPVAGLMGLLLLITNSMAEMFRFNLILRLLMQDATVIIMDCYLLYDLIVKSYDILNEFENPEITEEICKTINSNQEKIDYNKLNNTKTTTIKKFQINRIMQQQINYQIELLIKELFMLSDSKTIQTLKQDSTLQNEAFKRLLEDEASIRDKESYFSMSKANRNYKRKFLSTRFIANINNSLTIINSYVILLQSNLNLTIKKFEIIQPEEYKKIWTKILCSKEYNDYIKPVLKTVLISAGEDVKTISSDSLSKAINEIKAAETQNENENENSDIKGGYKFKKRIKRKTTKKGKHIKKNK